VRDYFLHFYFYGILLKDTKTTLNQRYIKALLIAVLMFPQNKKGILINIHFQKNLLRKIA
jgi:hypothetical protein